jgi:hypothetical protein
VAAVSLERIRADFGLKLLFKEGQHQAVQNGTHLSCRTGRKDVDWTHLARDTVQWQAVVNTTMNEDDSLLGYSAV